jgi:hypothetical protein
MATIKLPGAGTITTFDSPPSSESDPFSQWRAQWGKDYVEVKPEFSSDSERSRGRPEVATNNLSGIAVYRNNEAPAISSVEGAWMVPICLPPEGADTNKHYTYTASSWIGIDGVGTPGDKSKDLLQVGVDCDVTTDQGTLSWVTRAWWQWVPGASHWIKQFPVSPGDTIYCMIHVLEKDAKPKAAISLHNKTSRVVTSFTVDPIEETVLLGNSAEWIVEQFQSPQPVPLARFSGVWFEGAKASTGGVAEIIPGQTNQYLPFEIQNAQGQTISQAYIKGDSLVQCVYAIPPREAAAKAGGLG